MSLPKIMRELKKRVFDTESDIIVTETQTANDKNNIVSDIPEDEE